LGFSYRLTANNVFNMPTRLTRCDIKIC